MRHSRFGPVIAPLTVLALAISVAAAAGPEEAAVRAAFPEADRITKSTLFLGAAEQERAAELARAPVDSRLFNVHKAAGGDGEPLGYAFIDSRTVRTKTATFLVALSPAGRVREVRILGWHEPTQYQPGERWLGQFTDQGLEEALRLGGNIQAMSGASFTSRTLTDGVRRLLAVYRVKLADKD